MHTGAKIAAFSVVLLVAVLTHVGCSTAQPSPAADVVVPNPVLVFLGTEFYETGGKAWTRYRYMVANADAFPNLLFAAAPNLPPCGANANASRTWVELFDKTGKRLYGFCALGSNRDLGTLWFAIERDALPPSWVYIELIDRELNVHHKSNDAETTM